MRRPLALAPVGLRGPDLQAAIHLTRVGADDGSADPLREVGGDVALPGRGGTAQDENAGVVRSRARTA
jgi:hypothetical protein